MPQPAYPAITQALLTRGRDYFGAAFREPLTNYLAKVEELIQTFRARRPEICFDTETIMTSAGRTMMNALITLCSRSFLDFLLRVKDDLHGDSPEARYQDFMEGHLLPNQMAFYSQETELGRLVKQRVDYSVKAFREFLERFDHDCGVIRDQLGIDVRSIDDVRFSAGDTHNSGKTVFQVQVNGGERFLYKPHATANDAILSHLLQWMNEGGRLRLPLRHVRTVSRENYGWQEFVPHKACQSKTEAENYMYRLGCLLFVSYLTCCNDLHMENIIAGGEYPFLVDLETMCVNQYGFSGYGAASASSWDLFLSRSVFFSLLLPANFQREKPGASLDMSGILAGVSEKRQSDEKVYRLVNGGTDQICYALQPMSDYRSSYSNIAVFDGQRLHAGDYQERIAEGFRDAYTFLMEEKEAYRSLVDGGLFDDGVYRMVLRDTMLYGKYLLASYHPTYLKDRRGVFQRLKGTGTYINPAHKGLVEMEIRQLLNDDIPYFYTTFQSLDLYGPDGECCVGFFEKSAREQILEKLDQLSEVDLYRQLYCICCAISRPKGKGQSLGVYPVPGELFVSSALAERANALTDWIVDLREHCHRIDAKPDEAPTYFTILTSFQANSVGLEQANLYQGIGSALFELHYDRVRCGLSKDEALARMEKAGRIPDFPKTDESQPQGAIGLFDGLGSYLYLYGLLYLYSGQERYETYVKELCDRIMAAGRAEDTQADVISGYAGVLIGAFRLLERLPSLTKLKELVAFCGEQLYQRWQQKRLPQMTGFAHGCAGFSTALLMAGKLIAKEAFFDAGMDLVRQEDACYDAELGAWRIPGRDGVVMNAWCYGGPGLLVARTLSMRCARVEDMALLEADRAIALELTKREVKRNLWLPILCHGLPGNLEVLRWYARETGEASVDAVVAEGDARLLEHIQKKGILCDFPANVLDISFMTGLSGLGYYLLKMTGSDFPSVLALEAL